MKSVGVRLEGAFAELKRSGPPALSTILVVEDDEALRELVSVFLVEEGYRVVVASNGARALESLQAGRPTLILLDDRMPIMDGWTFWKEMHATPGAEDIPVVWTSADPDIRKRVDDIGAAGCLPKPYQPEELISTVRRSLIGLRSEWAMLESPPGEAIVELAWETGAERGGLRERLEPGEVRRVEVPPSGDLRVRVGQGSWIQLRGGEYASGR